MTKFFDDKISPGLKSWLATVGPDTPDESFMAGIAALQPSMTIWDLLCIEYHCMAGIFDKIRELQSVETFLQGTSGAYMQNSERLIAQTPQNELLVIAKAMLEQAVAENWPITTIGIIRYEFSWPDNISDLVKTLNEASEGLDDSQNQSYMKAWIELIDLL